MGLQQTSIQFRDCFYPHYYLCSYLPVSMGKDTLSHSLLKFKRGRQPDLNAWIDCSLEMLGSSPIQRDSVDIAPDNVIIPPGSPIIPPDSIILRALHHDETTAREDEPTSLDKLGSALAHQFKGSYLPRLLRKSLPTQEIKGLSKEQREAELRDLYFIDAACSHFPTIPASQTPPSFLIIDDILTTGTTVKMIIGAILQSYPTANCAVFTLAKADYDSSLNQSAPFRDKTTSSDRPAAGSSQKNQPPFIHPPN